MPAVIDETRYTYDETADGLFEIIDTHTDTPVGVVGDRASAILSAQRLSALFLANSLRVERSRIKREIHSQPNERSSRETLAAVIEDNPTALASMRVEALLRSVRYHINRRRRLTLRYTGCSETVTVGNLTARQRGRLCKALRMTRDELGDAVQLKL